MVVSNGAGDAGVVVADGEEVCFDAMATCSWSSFPSIRATSCRTHSFVTGDVGASEIMSEKLYIYI